MNFRIATFLAVTALAGLGSLPALAGDDMAMDCGGCEEKKGEEKKGGECTEGAKKECTEAAKKECSDGQKACGDAAECAGCVEGAKEGKDCCKAKMARTDLEVVTFAAVEGTSEAAKKVLAAIPPAAMEKVEAARKAAFEQLAKIQGVMAEMKTDFDAACAEAKAKGAEVACDVKATFEKDMATLHAKAKEQIDLCAKTIREAIGDEKVKELSADCRKAGDMAKAAGARIKAAAAKLLEKKAGAGEGKDASDGECEEAKKSECGETKKCEEKKPAEKDPQ